MKKLLVLAAALAPALAHAEPQKKLYVRAGVAFVDPITSSSPLELADVDGPASLAISNGPIAGSGATVSSATIMAIIVGYRLPFLDHRLSVETILGLPFTVKMQATGTLANQSLAPTVLGIPTGVGPLGSDLAEATAVPPVVTAVYSLGPFGPHGVVTPYVGAGVSVMITTNAHATNPVITMAGQPDFSISPAPGLVLQSGLDAKIWKNIYARLDVKFMLMHAHAEMHHIQMATPELPLFGTVEVGTAKMDMWLDPLIIQAGVGTDF